MEHCVPPAVPPSYGIVPVLRLPLVFHKEHNNIITNKENRHTSKYTINASNSSSFNSGSLEVSRTPATAENSLWMQLTLATA